MILEEFSFSSLKLKYGDGEKRLPRTGYAIKSILYDIAMIQ